MFLLPVWCLFPVSYLWGWRQWGPLPGPPLAFSLAWLSAGLWAPPLPHRHVPCVGLSLGPGTSRVFTAADPWGGPGAVGLKSDEVPYPSWWQRISAQPSSPCALRSSFCLQGCCGRDDPKARGWPRLCHCGPCLLTHPGKVPSAPVTWSWHQQQQGGPLSSIMETWRVGLSALLLTGNLGVIEGQGVACWVPGLKSCGLFGIF